MNKPVMPELPNRPPEGYDTDDMREYAGELHTAWEAHCAQLELRLEKLRDLCGCAYQMAGVHDAPVAWLDALSDAASETPLDEWRVQGDLIDTLLPYCPPDKAAALEARLREVEGLAGKWRFEVERGNGITASDEDRIYYATKSGCADELTATLEPRNG